MMMLLMFMECIVACKSENRSNDNVDNNVVFCCVCARARGVVNECKRVAVRMSVASK